MYNATFKTIIFGDESPGKTTLIQRYLPDLYVSDQTMTIGVDFKVNNVGVDLKVKSLTVDGLKVKLQVWVFGREKRFRLLIPTYVRNARGGLFLYDITSSSSIGHIDDWLSLIRKELKPEDMFPILAVGIIPDEECERQVSREEGIKISKSRNLTGFLECNPKTGKNVEKAFEVIARLMLERIGHQRRIKKEANNKTKDEESMELPERDVERTREMLRAFQNRTRKRDKEDRFPYPYVFKPPSPPDDLALAPRTQLRQPPKKKDTEEKIHCQYCGLVLTKEEQFTHSCKKKPKNK